MKKPVSTLALFVFALISFFATRAFSAERTVYYLSVDGIVNPVMAEYLKDGLKEASSAGAAAVVIQIDTPGGLDLSMREIVKAMLSSDVPVAVYVAPAGSRAASAGVYITYAADVAAMAPGTNIGSAHPVNMGGEKMDEVMSRKVENDAAAYLRGIALKRKRNAEWAEKAVRLSVNITAEEALKLNVIDVMAATPEELLEKLDGMKVATPSGYRLLKTKGASVKRMDMGLRARILDAITNPNVAYVLMMIGLAGLYFELSNPGLIFPGVIGAVCLVLAFYAFQTLSVNYAGLLLIGLAVIFFIVEIKVVSYGLLAIAGMVSLLLGSLMLFNSPLPFMRISVWVVLPTVAFIAAVVFGTMYYAMKIFRKRPVSGAEGLVGREGAAVEDIAEGAEGMVFVEGEYWSALPDAPLKNGDRVRVTEVRGLHLRVTRI